MLLQQDLQSGVGDGLAGEVPLDLGLVDTVHADPDEGPPDGQCPESVSPQWVHVEASQMEMESVRSMKRTKRELKYGSARLIN